MAENPMGFTGLMNNPRITKSSELVLQVRRTSKPINLAISVFGTLITQRVEDLLNEIHHYQTSQPGHFSFWYLTNTSKIKLMIFLILISPSKIVWASITHPNLFSPNIGSIIMRHDSFIQTILHQMAKHCPNELLNH